MHHVDITRMPSNVLCYLCNHGGMHPFVVGQEYARSRLTEFLGSRQSQSGVLWGSHESGCLVCTSGGRGGKKAGYSDEGLVDGSWWYFGQGQVGDQNLLTTANAKLASGRMSVLLFTTREPTAGEVRARGGYGKLFAFRGEFNVAGFEFFVPMEGRRRGDRLLRFRLAPADSGHTSRAMESGRDATGPADLTALQGRLNEQAENVPAVGLSLQEYRKRSSDVHEYALRRAAGVCEGCDRRAPFVDATGNAFLEVHHLTRLADDGPDAPANVVAVCPNCHRRAHHAIDRAEFGRVLRERAAAAEERVARFRRR